MDMVDYVTIDGSMDEITHARIEYHWALMVVGVPLESLAKTDAHFVAYYKVEV